MTSAPTQAGNPARAAQHRKALAFHAAHREGVLVLPNCWDVASARLIAQAGAAAVATTSAGVSWSLGAPDGERLPRERAVEAIARIAAAVDVPVTADIEGGYAATAAALPAMVRAVIDAGAVGINIEDSNSGTLRPVAEQAERIAEVRREADAAGLPLFVNARLDGFLLGGEPSVLLDETSRRAETYVAAGADGVFVPGVHDLAVCRELARRVAAPVNVMAGPGAPSVAELAAAGVRRVSTGMAVAQAAYALTREAARELLTSGTYGRLVDAVGYDELNGLLAGV